ncbi:MAG: hypothetical protein ACXWRA_07475 [Pseudobdellovibrionaceae bacterium]
MTKLSSLMIFIAAMNSTLVLAQPQNCEQKAIAAAKALANLNNVKNSSLIPKKVLRSHEIAFGEDYSSIVTYSVGSDSKAHSLTYAVVIGDASEVGGNACEVISISAPQS